MLFKFEKIITANNNVYFTFLEISYYSEDLSFGKLNITDLNSNITITKIYCGFLAPGHRDILLNNMNQNSRLDNPKMKVKATEILVENLKNIYNSKEKSIIYIDSLELLVSNLIN